jgi:hypothetical protein
MATSLKLRRGTTTAHSTFTGAEGEVTVDTTKDTIVVHDGSTAGGFPLLKENNPAYTGTLTGGTGVINIGSGQMYKDANGNVGIGVSSPACALNIATTNFGIELQRYNATSTAMPALELKRSKSGTVGTNSSVSSGDGIGRISFYGADGANWVLGAQIQAEVDGTPGSFDMPGRIVFSTTADGSSTTTERMRINSSGNVGIGTNSPLQKLSVQNAGFVAIALNNTASGSWKSELGFYNGASQKWAMGIDILSSGNNNFYWYDNAAGQERMRIDSSGNVGIGNSSPAQKLDVNGNIKVGVNQWIGNASGASYIADDGVVGGAMINGGGFRIYTGGSNERMRINAGGDVGIGTSNPGSKLDVNGQGLFRGLANKNTATAGTGFTYFDMGIDSDGAVRTAMSSSFSGTSSTLEFSTAISGTRAERMRIDTSGNVIIGKTSTDFSTAGAYFANNELVITRNAGVTLSVNRLTDDGSLVQFFQASSLEGSITVSGTTVSYNGGHISRWSQLYNETEKVEVYRGTVLESVDAMCEWYDKEGNALPNEQATKTIVSTTPASKAVAGVFDLYDNDDEDNPHDFYVAQSGDFVIRVSAGTVVQNGDLLESAGDGTARVQADDICRSSTIAKVTSNYVSETYADGSFCVPCILMIG